MLLVVDLTPKGVKQHGASQVDGPSRKSVTSEANQNPKSTTIYRPSRTLWQANN